MPARLTLVSEKPHTSVARSLVYAVLRLVSSTPFGTPVVPDVYSSNTGSSAATSMRRSFRGAVASQSSYSASSDLSWVVPADHPDSTARRDACSSATTITFGEASTTIAAISAGASRQFRPTRMAPTLLHPKASSKNTGWFFESTATRSPGPTPAAASASAAALLRRSRSAKLSVVSAKVSAGASGRVAASVWIAAT